MLIRGRNVALEFTATSTCRLMSAVIYVTKRAIIEVHSIVSERIFDILTSIIAQLLTSRPFPDLCRGINVSNFTHLYPNYAVLEMWYNKSVFILF